MKFDYKKEINTIEWQKKSCQIKMRDNFTCQECGCQDEIMHVHHTQYISGLHYWEYPDRFLTTLCKKCHERKHMKFLTNKFQGNDINSIKGTLEGIIKIPRPFLSVFSNYRIIECKILFELFRVLQVSIDKLIEGVQYENLPNVHYDVHQNSNDIHVVLRFSNLTKYPCNYKYFKSSIMVMANTNILIQDYKSKENIFFEPLFKIGEEYTKYSGEIKLIIPEIIGRLLLSIEKGYIKVCNNVFLKAKSKYTIIMYLFLCLYKGIKENKTATTSEVRKLLEKNTSPLKWSNFRKRILDVAKEEMHNLADNGFSDIYFDYSIITNKEKNYRGDPDKIEFLIHKSI